MSDIGSRGLAFPGPDTDWPSDQDLRARVRQQEASGRLGLLALAGAELPELMDQVVNTVAEVLSAEYCELLELLPDRDRLLLLSGVGWKEGLVGRATVGTGLESQAGYTMISETPVVVEDLRNEVRFDGPPLLREHGVVSGMTARVHVRGHVWGVLGVHTRYRRTFGEDEMLFLQEVAAVLGAAIERKLAEDETEEELAQRRASATAAERRFTFLAEANEMLSASTDYSTVLATAARLTVPALADWCFVDAVEGGNVHRLTLTYTDSSGKDPARELEYDYPVSANAAHGTPKVWRTGQPELIPEINDSLLVDIARGARHLQTLRRLKPTSFICVPLRVGGHTLGALGLVTAEPGRRYGNEELVLAEGVAHIAAVALDNARRHLPESELARELVERARRERHTVAVPDTHGDVPDLTPRQMEVLKLLSEGKSAREVGAELYLSQATVRNHIRSLLQALGAHSQLEALARARRSGLLSD